MNMKDLIYNEQTGEFEIAGTNKLVQQESPRCTQTFSNSCTSTYYYIEGISCPHKMEQLRNMQLPKGTRIRKMLENTWYPLEHFGLRGELPSAKSVPDNPNSRDNSPRTIATSSIDLAYFYIEGENIPQKLYEIKRMILPKGTKIRKMLENTWYPIEHYGVVGVNSVQSKPLNNSTPQHMSIASSTTKMRFEDLTYFYIEGETLPYRWYIIKNMHLPKGTRIRKMLDDKWIIFE